MQRVNGDKLTIYDQYQANAPERFDFMFLGIHKTTIR